MNEKFKHVGLLWRYCNVEITSLVCANEVLVEFYRRFNEVYFYDLTGGILLGVFFFFGKDNVGNYML